MDSKGTGQVSGFRTELIVSKSTLGEWEFLEMISAKYFALAALTNCCYLFPHNIITSYFMSYENIFKTYFGQVPSLTSYMNTEHTVFVLVRK